MENHKHLNLRSNIFYFLLFFLFVIFHLPFLSSCQKSCNSSNNTQGKRSQDSTVYSLENFTPFTLDTFVITKYIQHDSSQMDIASDLVEFYQKRFYQYAWFTQSGMSNAVHLLLNRLNNAAHQPQDNWLKISQVLDSIKLDSNYIKKNQSKLAQFELDFTSAYFKYAKYEFYGIDKNPKDLEWYIPRKKKNFQLLLEKIACCEKEDINFEPSNNYYRALKKELVKYKELDKQFVDIEIQRDSFPLQLNDIAEILVPIKAKLYAFGDLSKRDSTTLFNPELVSGIKQFQYRLGLDSTGNIDKNTFKEIQKPIGYYLKKIIINMERLRWMTDSIPSSYFLVNIPEYKLHIFDKGRLDWSMNVVVGAQATATTIFEDEMSNIVINPYWGVPQSIVKNEIIPAMLRNSNYINRNHMEVLKNNQVVSPYSIAWHDIKGNPPFTVRQKPGPFNALGKVKFLFPNNYNIYFHDTPAKKYFVEQKRAFSHGCIRLGEPIKLAEYILTRDSIFTVEQVAKELKKDKEKWISLKHRIPVIISYFTAWVDSKGMLQFRDDIYGHDRKLETEIFE